MKRFIPVFISLSIFTSFLTPPAHSYDSILPVTTVPQDTSNWCWAASVQSILNYYEVYPRQCDLANYAWGRSDCCVNPLSYNCNQANYNYGTYEGKNVETILKDWGVNATALSRSLFQQTSVNEINARRPFIIGLEYSTTGGHDIVGYGYEVGGQYRLPFNQPLAKEIYATAATALATGKAVDITGNGLCNSYEGIDVIVVRNQ
jgi:hypothetical protein